jgi:hypothetical protein
LDSVHRLHAYLEDEILPSATLPAAKAIHQLLGPHSAQVFEGAQRFSADMGGPPLAVVTIRIDHEGDGFHASMFPRDTQWVQRMFGAQLPPASTADPERALRLLASMAKLDELKNNIR